MQIRALQRGMLQSPGGTVLAQDDHYVVVTWRMTRQQFDELGQFAAGMRPEPRKARWSIPRSAIFAAVFGTASIAAGVAVTTPTQPIEFLQQTVDVAEIRPGESLRFHATAIRHRTCFNVNRFTIYRDADGAAVAMQSYDGTNRMMAEKIGTPRTMPFVLNLPELKPGAYTVNSVQVAECDDGRKYTIPRPEMKFSVVE